jgi:hypothetical protein
MSTSWIKPRHICPRLWRIETVAVKRSDPRNALGFSGIPNDHELSWSKSFKMSREFVSFAEEIEKNRDFGLKLCPAVEWLYFDVCIRMKQIVLRGSPVAQW